MATVTLLFLPPSLSLPGPGSLAAPASLSRARDAVHLPPVVVAPSPTTQRRRTKKTQDVRTHVMACDPAELRLVFELFDRDGDGRITREEMAESLERLGMAAPGDELAAVIARIDADGDGCVDMDEFAELYDAIMRGGAGSDDEADMREAFNVFDQNGDGFITVDELRAVLASLGMKQGREQDDCRRMIGQVDRDGDGRVDFGEFKEMMRGGGFAALGPG
jgi:calcium-binding protein CML